MRSLKRLVLAVALASGAVAHSSPAGAQPEIVREHCVVEVVGQLANGELRVSDPRCFSSTARALSAANVVGYAPAGSRLLSVTLGTHCDLTGGGGQCFSVVGDSCIGGWLNVSVAWDNRISSTIHGLCGNISHFTGSNLTGSSQTTAGGSGAVRNLQSGINNQVSSIQYWP